MQALSPVLVSNNYPPLLDAAVKGDGVILGWQHLVKSRMEAGKLCSLFNKPLRVERGYYLKLNTASSGKPYVQPFIEFVLADLAGPEPGPPPPPFAGR